MSNQTWYTKNQTETNPEYGKLPEKRTISEKLEKGILVIDKPFGPTSNQVTSWVKKILDLKKAGHFGTLDPNATGVLPIGINKATRVNEIIAKKRKKYVFEAKLKNEKTEVKIEEALNTFKGVNKQVPPEKSAVKRQERERHVYDINLLEIKGNKILGNVKCESGFYVRTLIKQLGDKLETEAEMTELRRVEQGTITEKETNTLQQLSDAKHYYEDNQNQKLNLILKPIEYAVRDVKKIAVKDSAVNALTNGANLGTTGISKIQEGIKNEETVAITTLKGELIATATALMTTQKIYDAEEPQTAAELEKVFMSPEIYPKRWKQ